VQGPRQADPVEGREFEVDHVHGRYDLSVAN
jgi:hypothetical protein